MRVRATTHQCGSSLHPRITGREDGTRSGPIPRLSFWSRAPRMISCQTAKAPCHVPVVSRSWKQRARDIGARAAIHEISVLGG